MQKTCAQCGEQFQILDEDVALLKKMTPTFNGNAYEIPLPTMCFDCRLQRRLAFYNCRSLYKRMCGHTNKEIVSLYSPDKPVTAYGRESWWSDTWDPLAYGRDFDLNRPFFPQFRELMEAVPLISLNQFADNVNSDYTNDNYKLKNCYMVFDGEQGEDCYHGHSFVGIRSCMDFIYLTNCELCYECVHCSDGYNLKYSRYCKNCSDSWFLRDCIGCKSCFGCANLRQKQYCIYNDQKTKAEYEAFLQGWETTSWKAVQQTRDKTEEFFKTQPVRATRGEQNIDSTGDNINNCKNAFMCFDCNEQQDSRYCSDCMMGAKDLLDVHVWGNNLELSYNCCCCGANSRFLIGDYYAFEGCSDVYYSFFCCNASSHLLGCVGLRHQKHCILNKRYQEQEYHRLAERIVQHMQRTGEWGEFFSPEASAFGYNETMAQVWFPLSKEEVRKRGWQWSDYEVVVQADRTIPGAQLPDNADDVPDDVLNWAILCEVTKKPFKIVKQELAFYREHRLPLPRRHPDQRHGDRFMFKNPYKLWQRSCAKCKKNVQTSYAPGCPEIVYCDDCYLKTVY